MTRSIFKKYSEEKAALRLWLSVIGFCILASLVYVGINL
jgi:hypothetical protein